MQIKKFIKNKEDFTCENCKAQVVGDGYTNHCSKCLWSKHVDVNPGDRAALESCGGMMEPVGVEKDGKNKNDDGFIIVHECKKCGHQKRNRISKEDDFDKVVEISKAVAS